MNKRTEEFASFLNAGLFGVEEEAKPSQLRETFDHYILTSDETGVEKVLYRGKFGQIARKRDELIGQADCVIESRNRKRHVEVAKDGKNFVIAIAGVNHIGTPIEGEWLR